VAAAVRAAVLAATPDHAAHDRALGQSGRGASVVLTDVRVDSPAPAPGAPSDTHVGRRSIRTSGSRDARIDDARDARDGSDYERALDSRTIARRSARCGKSATALGERPYGDRIAAAREGEFRSACGGIRAAAFAHDTRRRTHARTSSRGADAIARSVNA